jgi:uncharacterized membrane protein YqjE
MAEPTVGVRQLGAASKVVGRRLLTIGENRLELLTLEVQEEIEHLTRALLLALGAAVFGLLAGMTLTAAIVVLLWANPVAVLLALTALYGLCAVLLWRVLAGMRRDWQTLSASLAQFRKDCACLQTILG